MEKFNKYIMINNEEEFIDYLNKTTKKLNYRYTNIYDYKGNKELYNIETQNKEEMEKMHFNELYDDDMDNLE